ncbi:RING-box protein 2 [Camponotus floridanus]|uniref:RING-box protein 2 n=1 Tax=Camponotus floridanus TaxID=104421 RepID=E2A7I4_CAMFO|nr:RING-box protein 2 [Camponotus floridanus]
MADCEQDPGDRLDGDNQKNDKMFTLKKWNAVAMWSWDVECDTCAICRVQVMVACNMKRDLICIIWHVLRYTLVINTGYKH